MKKTTAVIAKTDYEVYYFPLKQFLSKSGENRFSFNTQLRQELEKVHPSFDHNTIYFKKLIIKDKKLQLMIIVIQNTILSQYEMKRYKKITAQGIVLISRKNTHYLLFAGILVGLVIVSVILWNTGKNSNNKAAVLEGITPVVVEIKEITTEERFMFEEAIHALTMLFTDKKVHYEMFVFTRSGINEESQLTVKIQSAFPEDLDKYFTELQKKYIDYGKVSYVNNNPTFTASFKINTPIITGESNENLILLRTLVIQNGGSLLYEDSLLFEIKALIPSKKVIELMRDIVGQNNRIPIEKIELYKEKNDEISIVIKTGNEGCNLLGTAFFTDYMAAVYSQKINETNVVSKKSAAQTDKALQGEIVGKIQQEDGSTKIFYKTKEGKLVSEVSE